MCASQNNSQHAVSTTLCISPAGRRRNWVACCRHIAVPQASQQARKWAYHRSRSFQLGYGGSGLVERCRC